MSLAMEVEFRNQVLGAAMWKASRDDGDLDHTYLVFKQVMEYRRKIADSILQETDENNLKNLRESFENCNARVIQVLGLYTKATENP